MLEEKHALDFLRQFSSVSTVRNYKSALRDLFQVVYEKRDPVEELADRYVSEDRDYRRDVEELLIALKGRAPKTIRTKLSAVKMFLVENDIDFKEKFWRRLGKRIQGHEAISDETVPNPQECRMLLNYLPVGGKALFMLLLSSGMRIGEALSLLPGDIDWEHDPVKIMIRREIAKNRRKRPTFISSETVEVLKSWLKVRDDYLETAVARTPFGKDADDPRVFPFSHANAYIIWSTMLKKAGEPWNDKDSVTNRYKIHPHVLRKYFRSRLPAANVPVDVVEALMGHGAYLTKVYRKYRVEQVAAFYKQGEHALLVFTESAEVNRLRTEVEDRNRQLQVLVNGLTTENLDLKQRFRKLEETVHEISSQVETLSKILEEGQ